MSDKPLFCLSLWRPWDVAFLRYGKRIENRSWSPPRAAIGQRIALHAAKRFDEPGAAAIEEVALERGLPLSWVGSVRGIFATAHLLGWTSDRAAASAHPAETDQAPWWSGPIAWLLTDVVPLPERLPEPGRQGLYRLDTAVAQRVREGEDRGRLLLPEL